MLYYNKYIKYKNKYCELKGGTNTKILSNFELKTFKFIFQDEYKHKSTDEYKHSSFFVESIEKEDVEIKERVTILNNLKKILRLLNKIKVSQDIKKEIHQYLYSHSPSLIQDKSQDLIQDKSQDLIQDKSQDILLIEEFKNNIFPLIDNFLKKKFNYKKLFGELYNLINDNNKDYFNILNDWIKINNDLIQKEFEKMVKINDDSEIVITENLNLIKYGPKEHLKNIPCIKYNNNIFVLLYSESEKYIGSVIYYIVNNDLYFISIYKSCINECTTCSKENSFSYKMISKIEAIGKENKNINSIRTCMETKGMADLLQNNGFFKRAVTCDYIDYKPYNIKILKEFISIDNEYLKQNIKYLSNSQINDNIIRINDIIKKCKENNNCNITEIVGISDSPLSLGSTDVNHIIKIINTKLLYFQFFINKTNENNFPIFKSSNIKSIILAAVKNDANAIIYVPTELLDFDIALEAVRNEGKTLRYVPNELKNNFIIALEAIINNGSAIQFVDNQLKNNKKFILKAIKYNSDIIRYLDKQFINKRIAFKAVRNNGLFLEYVPIHLIDYKIALVAVKNDGFALKYVPKTLSNYFTIALVAVYNKPSALKFVDKELDNYNKIVLEAEEGKLFKNNITNQWK